MGNNESVRPEGYPWMIPYLTVRSAEKALEFYGRVFGFQRVLEMPGDDGAIHHAEMKYQDIVIMFGPEGVDGKTARSPLNSNVESPINLYVYVEDIDDFVTRAKQEGATIIMDPQDMFWGDRISRISDCDHYVWTFATHKKL